MKEYGRVLLLTLYTIIDVAAPYSNIVWSRSPSSSYHYGSTHIILFLSRFPFTTHHISYVRQGDLVVKSLKTRSRAEFFREKSSYKHPIKKPHCFGKYPGWRNPSSIPPEKRVPKPPPETWWFFRIILGADFSLEKKIHLFKLDSLADFGVVCVFPVRSCQLNTWKLTGGDSPGFGSIFCWTPNYSPF